MSSLLPLFELVSGNRVDISGSISKVLIFLGYQVNAKVFLGTFIVLFVIRVVTQLISQSLTQYLGRKVLAQLGSRAFEQIIQNLPIGKIAEKSIGYYIGLAGDESFRASTLVIALTQFFAIFSLGVLYFVAIARYSVVAAELVFVLLMVSLLALLWMLKISHQIGALQTEESRKANTVFLDAINNLKAVRAFSAEKYVVGAYQSIIYGYARILFLLDEITISTKLIPILLLLIGSTVWLRWFAMPIESIGIAFIVTMIAYLMRFFPVVGQMVSLAMRIASDAKSGKDVTSLVVTRQDGGNLLTRSIGKVSQIYVNDVYFAYTENTENTEKLILKAVSFNLILGKSYALAGKSGVGKSTLIDLLLKFYLPTSGSLYINDVSISELSESEIRQKIILVSQETAIFDDTVMSNICMGKVATLQEVRMACQIACIDKVIESMEHGYETRLQYQGKNLSGGQRQRIAIARAVLRDPDMLILDESTSALDKVTQSQILENILKVYAEKIVVFVTHDPHIMSLVDEVIDLAHINKL